MLPRVVAVKVISQNTVHLTFTNQEERLFDVTKYLHYPVYESLKNPIFFQKVQVFNGTLVWDESIDFAPETLYLESVPVAQLTN